MAVVGGNLAEIGANEGSLRTTGEAALTTGAETGVAAAEFHAVIEEAAARLLRSFESVAGRLRADIDRAHRQLESSNWQGRSRDQAVLITADLRAQVEEVLASATATLTAEQRAFRGRADALVTDIENRFRRVMTQVDTEYGRVAEAARRTAENFEAADLTIRPG